MKKLITVKVAFEFVMLIDEESENPHESARGYVNQVIRETPEKYIIINTIPYDPLDVSFGWDEDCHPYGGTGTTKFHLENLE